MKPVLVISGESGNAFVILGIAKSVARKAGWTTNKITKVFEDATSGDYDHLLQVMMENFDVQ